MASELDFGAKTRMIAIEILNGDIFCFHENLLRYHSSYIDDRVKDKDRDEIENPVKLRLDWDVVECSDIPAPDANPLSLSMKMFTQWIYRIGARTYPDKNPDEKPDEKPEWLPRDVAPTLDVLINMYTLQLELECNDMEAIRSRLDHLEIFMPDGSVSPSAGSWKTLIAGILHTYNMRMERIRNGFE
ncbi:hypothetical protein ABKA04_006871 [Annulohypoxylon sp. FPYF3050]